MGVLLGSAVYCHPMSRGPRQVRPEREKPSRPLLGKMILAGRAYLLADQTKFDRHTPFRVPNMDKCAGVIVDTMPDAALASAWEAYGWKIILAR